MIAHQGVSPQRITLNHIRISEKGKIKYCFCNFIIFYSLTYPKQICKLQCSSKIEDLLLLHCTLISMFFLVKFKLLQPNTGFPFILNRLSHPLRKAGISMEASPYIICLQKNPAPFSCTNEFSGWSPSSVFIPTLIQQSQMPCALPLCRFLPALHSLCLFDSFQEQVKGTFQRRFCTSLLV